MPWIQAIDFPPKRYNAYPERPTDLPSGEEIGVVIAPPDGKDWDFVFLEGHELADWWAPKRYKTWHQDGRIRPPFMRRAWQWVLIDLMHFFQGQHFGELADEAGPQDYLTFRLDPFGVLVTMTFDELSALIAGLGPDWASHFEWVSEKEGFCPLPPVGPHVQIQAQLCAIAILRLAGICHEGICEGWPSGACSGWALSRNEKPRIYPFWPVMPPARFGRKDRAPRGKKPLSNRLCPACEEAYLLTQNRDRVRTSRQNGTVMV